MSDFTTRCLLDPIALVPDNTDPNDFSDTEPTDPPRCASCSGPIPALGPVVCSCCLGRGYCPVCGLLHGGARMCPEVAAVWAEQEAIEKAERAERVQEAAIHNELIMTSARATRRLAHVQA
jgi:hypothetical protein